MPNETLARRYATAIFQLATDSGSADAVGKDLHAFVDALAKDDDVNRFFRSPVVDRKQKSDAIAAAFSGLGDVPLHAMLLLIQKRRESLAPEIVAQYDVLERQARNAQTLNVTSARPLAKADLDALVAKLTSAFNTPFDVTQSVEPDLIGGVRITMGDKRIDGTIAGRLDDLARMLSTN